MAHSQEPASWFAPPDEEGYRDVHENDAYETDAEIEATDEDFVDYAFDRHGEEPLETEEHAFMPEAGADEAATDDGWILESVEEERRASGRVAARSPGSARLLELDEPAWALDSGDREAGPDDREDVASFIQEPVGGEQAEESEWYGREESHDPEEWDQDAAAAPLDEEEPDDCRVDGEYAEEEDYQDSWEDEEPGSFADTGLAPAAWEDPYTTGQSSSTSDSRPVRSVNDCAWEDEESEYGEEEDEEPASDPEGDHETLVVRARVAGMQARGLAWAIDGAIVVSAALMMIWIAGLVSGSGGAVSGVFGDAGLAVPAAVFMALMGAVYSATSVTLLGRTIGGALAKVRILDGHGETPDVLRASLRGLIAAFGVLALGVGLVWVLLDDRGQTLQDRVAGTFAVEG